MRWSCADAIQISLVLKHFPFNFGFDWQCLLNHKLLLWISWWCDINSIGMLTAHLIRSPRWLLHNSFRGKWEMVWARMGPTAVKQFKWWTFLLKYTRNNYWWWIYAYAVCAFPILWGISFWHSHTRLRLLMNKILFGFEFDGIGTHKLEIDKFERQKRFSDSKECYREMNNSIFITFPSLRVHRTVPNERNQQCQTEANIVRWFWRMTHKCYTFENISTAQQNIPLMHTHLNSNAPSDFPTNFSVFLCHIKTSVACIKCIHCSNISFNLYERFFVPENFRKTYLCIIVCTLYIVVRWVVVAVFASLLWAVFVKMLAKMYRCECVRV